MSRGKTLKPVLYKRGVNGNWCFRRFVNGKDKKINTGTPVKPKAESYVKRYIQLEIEAENQKQRGELAFKTARDIIMSIRGEEIERLSFDAGFKVYLDTTDDFMDLSVRYRTSFISTCKKFFAWCQANGLKYMDDVTDEVARNYARKLNEEHLSPKSFDDYIKILSKFFTTVDAMKKLPNRNPFNKVNIKRKQKGLIPEATHRPLEPEMITVVMKAATEAGEDWFDLFMVGLHTGMRLKDAALLQWNAIRGDFLEIIPFKTRRFGTIARIPISSDLRMMFDRRKANKGLSPYVNPFMAGFYLKGSSWVSNKAQDIFVKALGKGNTMLPKGEHRKVNVSIYSFESFRTTITTLLGSNNTEYRVIMEMLGWSDWRMLKIYEKKYAFKSDVRDREKIQSFNKLGILSSSTAGLVPAEKRLLPTRESLAFLIQHYSNVVIGKIYDISDVAVGKWLKKFNLKRKTRILSSDVMEEEIIRIREKLKAA